MIRACRIIPARAGFTRRSRSSPPARGDHPRSRGVYDGARRRLVVGGGSSPLARGLHEAYREYLNERRIIPARAGFTLNPPELVSHEWDHPRSRGVYRDISWKNPLAAGSSPLARGLHAAAHHPRVRRGIIPARAGFTRRGRTRCCRYSDHPRSRGVYRITISRSCAGFGSSPLARGLRAQAVRNARSNRIIPARAGFTRRALSARPQRADHPRSRGVYINHTTVSGNAQGSSPLARGLLARRHRID